MASQPGNSGAPPANGPDDRVESWKEIAAYLKRDVRTVQRWEKREGLPVYRHVHNRLGTVYAYKAELDAWWNNRRPRLEAEEAAQKRGDWRRWAMAASALLILAAAVAWMWRPASQPLSPPGAVAAELVPDRDELFFAAPRQAALAGTEEPGLVWLPTVAEGLAFEPRIAAESAYDPETRRLTVVGGFGADFLNDVWVLERADGSGGRPQWRQIRARGKAPRPRMGHSVILDARNNRLVLFGGRNATEWFNDVWVLSGANGLGGEPRWIELRPTGDAPQSRAGHSAVYDPGTRRMIVCGGSSSAPGYYSDVWVLEHASAVGGPPRWLRLAPTGPGPGGLNEHSAVLDPPSGRMIVMGGHPLPGATDASPEVWLLESADGVVGAPRWIPLPARGPKPTPRSEHIALYNPHRNEMMVAFGSGHVRGRSWNLSDVWSLRHANGMGGEAEWRELHLADPRPGPRSLGSAALAGNDGGLILFGGHVGGARTPLRDIWFLTKTDHVLAEFSETFDAAELSSAWNPLSKASQVSLTENPGHLRYRVTARPAQRLATGVSRAFRGEHWAAEVKVSYSMGTSGGGRDLHTLIRFGTPGPSPGRQPDDALEISRGRSDWGGQDRGTLWVQFAEHGQYSSRVDVALNPRDTYVWRVSRDGTLLTVEVSEDGTQFREVARHRFGPQITSVLQFVSISGRSFANFDSYADYDYIRLTQNSSKGPYTVQR